MDANVYVTRAVPQPGIDILKQHCAVVEVNPLDRALAKEELIEAVKQRDAVLCLLTDTIDADVIHAATTVKIFANYAVGYDNIDVEEATKNSIAVTNTPGVLTEATSDLAWALIFAVARKIVPADRYTREGRFTGWSPALFLGEDVTGKTLGIVGAGRIGTATALKSAGFKMPVLYTSPHRNETLEQILNARRVALKELLAQADVVTLHTALTNQTRHLIGGAELALMKPTAILINTSRGAVIDEKELVKALERKQIAAAGLDVYEDEPRLNKGLSELENVVLLPHIGSATFAARTTMAVMAAENIVAVLKGTMPPNCVNPSLYRR